MGDVWQYIVVCGVSGAVALMTLFSGFGLGTLLMPAFALFFSVEIAIAATAVVHLANNLFKLGLMGKYAKRRVIVRFGLPAIAGAFVGAWLLTNLSDLSPLITYSIGERECRVTLLKIVVAAMIISFSLFDLIPRLKQHLIDQKYLPLGGVLSGFFGGLSGHQGAVRSAFLIKLGLTTQAFVGSGVVIAVMVDVTRLLVYGGRYAIKSLDSSMFDGSLPSLIVAASIAAILGSFLGKRLLKKVTIDALQTVVGVMLIGVAVALGVGLI